MPIIPTTGCSCHPSFAIISLSPSLPILAILYPLWPLCREALPLSVIWGLTAPKSNITQLWDDPLQMRGPLMLNRFVGRNTVFTSRFAAATPSKLRGQNAALKMRGGFWGVVQGALKNIDFVKGVKGNLRTGSQAGQSARGVRPAGRVRVA